MKFWRGLRELAQSLASSPGSQGVIRKRRWTKVDPNAAAATKRKHRRRALKAPTFDLRARLKRAVAAIPERVSGKGITKNIPRKIRRAIVCLEAGKPNTGRQWRKLRKQLRARAAA